MVEKVVDNSEDTVLLVEAFSELSRNHGVGGEQTVGATIEAFEETASGLFSIQVSQQQQKSRKERACRNVRQL
jgi:hypothetical protein